MTATLRITLLVALAAACIPAVATGQDTSTESLLRRIELLERANTGLEQRVRELESLIRSKPSKGRAVTTSARWQDLANWRQLNLGMTMDEVRELLGEPERVEGGSFTYWYWTDAKVSFYSGKVDGWSEPSSVLGGVLGSVEDGLGDQPLYAGIGSITNPELIPSSRVQPLYPEKARKAKIQGIVVLQAVIHKDGSVGDIQVLQSPGSNFGFDESAIAAVRQWRYKPALQNGEPVVVYFTVTVPFSEGH